jgi:hypothetical protein
MTFSRKFMDNLQHPRIDCTRAEYAEVFGVRPDPDVIGVCVFGGVFGADRTRIVKEYVFIDEPTLEDFLDRDRAQAERAGLYVTLWKRTLAKGQAADIAELERLYKL